MKKLILLLIIVSITSCKTIKVKEIGRLNMVSNRNVSLKENYTLIKSYTAFSKKELKKNQAATLNEAVDNLVRNVAGGELVQNVKIYLVNYKYYAIEGDVYGIEANANVNGFRKGDHVTWKDNFIRYTGVISDLKDNKEATVIQDENNKIRTVRYNEMQKL